MWRKSRATLGHGTGVRWSAHRRGAGVLALSFGVLAGMLAGGVASAAASPASGGGSAGLTLVGSFRQPLSAPATVIVEVETRHSIDARGVPRVLVDNVIAEGRATGAGFQITVPDGAVARYAAARAGVPASLVVVVEDAGRVSSEHVPVEASPGGTLPATWSVGTMPAFSRVIALANADQASLPPSAGPHDNVGCRWLQDGPSVEASTRVGEVHVADVKGMSMRFVYSYQADSTLSVGVSIDNGPWSDDGSVTLTNHFSGSGGYSEPTGPGVGYVGYAADHMYFAEYINNGAAACPGLQYMTQVASSTGDAYAGAGAPPMNPWRTCHRDPGGFVTIQGPGGWFDADRGTGVNLSDAASAFGFTFGGHTGYSTNIYDDYTNNSGISTYLCGAGQMPDVPVIYNTTY